LDFSMVDIEKEEKWICRSMGVLRFMDRRALAG
jgi:hypothetical protein